MNNFSSAELLILAAQYLADGMTPPDWLARLLPDAEAEIEWNTRERIEKRARWKAAFYGPAQPIPKMRRRWRLLGGKRVVYAMAA